VGAGSSSIAVRAASRRWLSYVSLHMTALTNAKITPAKWTDVVAAALVMLGVILGIGAFLRFLGACAVRPDSPEELLTVLQRDRVVANTRSFGSLLSLFLV